MTDDSEDLTPLILYATETGNAQDAADYIARQCRHLNLQCRLQDMEAYPPEELITESLVIFVVSTTGSGVEPRSMTPLWNMLLRSDLPTNLFDETHFAVFGLGDSSYERFCWSAKKLSRRLVSLGATEICERGEGDDQHMLGTEGALIPWSSVLLDVLQALLQVKANFVEIPDLPPPRASLTRVTPVNASPPLIPDPLAKAATYHLATMKTNKRITAADWFQDVRHFEFTFDEDVQYKPGDVAVIHPAQSHEEVETFLTTMGWGNIADELYTIKQLKLDQSLPSHLPTSVTLRALFTRYLSFTSVPRRSFFTYLHSLTPDPIEREKLDEFLSPTPEGADDLYEYVYKVRRTIAEVLDEFHGARHALSQKLEYLFDIFPPIRPREFSIASCCRDGEGENRTRKLELCVAIIRYRTRLKVPRRGLGTAYLADMRAGHTLMIGLKRGYIKLPGRPQTPIICIGPGTGIAPMRSLIRQRVASGVHANTLYFGCRSATKDQHYAQEWADLASEGKLSYRVAFSRDGPEGVKRTYVQDLIEEDKEVIWKLIEEEKAWVYISGSSNRMPAAVKSALTKCVKQCGGMSGDDAKEYVRTMEREGRLTEECWS